jgi:hypothetical protein
MSTDALPGSPSPGPFGDPSLAAPAPTAAAPVITEPSIVDTILNLDEFLSGDVRLAEKTGRFCTKPDLEAKIDELELELAGLIDATTGQPLENDDALAAGRTAYVVANEIKDLRFEYAEAIRGVRMRQMDDITWQAFRDAHKEAFAPNAPDDSPERRAMLDALLVATAAAPKITAEKLAALRSQVGSPQIDELITTAWIVNTKSGVNVPKSPLSSAVLRLQERSKN